MTCASTAPRGARLRRPAQPQWRLAQREALDHEHKATSIRAACMGLGFAWYPEENIREELASRALVPLPRPRGVSVSRPST